MAPAPNKAIRVAVSACLLGQQVRWDGGHKRHGYVVEVLDRYFTLVPVCPEVDLGLGVPREPLRLVRSGDRVLLMADQSGTDHTEAMLSYAQRRIAELGRAAVAGYVLKERSPSCGAAAVPTVTQSGQRSRSGRGLFANALIRLLPALPVEEAQRLDDPALARLFVERVLAYHRATSAAR